MLIITHGVSMIQPLKDIYVSNCQCFIDISQGDTSGFLTLAL